MEIKEVKESQSMIGKNVDLPLEDFKNELKEQKVSVGVMTNLKLNLTSVYNDLTVRKEDIINQGASGA